MLWRSKRVNTFPDIFIVISKGYTAWKLPSRASGIYFLK